MAISNIRIISTDGVTVTVTFDTGGAPRAYVEHTDMAGSYDPADNVPAAALGGGSFEATFTPKAPIFKFQCVETFSGVGSGDRIFEIAQIAPPPPVVGSDKATVSWSTPFDGDETVEYGLTSDLGLFANDGDTGTQHQVELRNLSAGTTYHFRCVSVPTGTGSLDDYALISPVASFATAATPPPVSVKPDRLDVQVSATVVKRGDPITVTATLTGKDTSGQRVPVAGASVAFSFAVLARGTFAPNPVLTDAQGKAVTVMTAGPLPGPAALIAKCGAVVGGQIVWIKWN